MKINYNGVEVEGTVLRLDLVPVYDANGVNLLYTQVTIVLKPSDGTDAVGS